jgi:alpha-ketoglutarate-dependent 2,4-dichlorophenoxyacetate dioxygenase
VGVVTKDVDLEVWPITEDFAAEIGDVDLVEDLSDSVVDSIKSAFWKYSVLVFPNQHLSIDQHLDFARRIGELETTVADCRPGSELRVPRHIADVSNLTHNHQIWDADSPQRLHELGNRLWHTDSSFKRRSALASLLYARSIPPVGGHTEFANMRAAYDSLSAERRHQIEPLIAEHCIRYSRARIGFTDFTEEEVEALPPVGRPLVRRIRQTGRPSLYLASHAGKIWGMSDEDGAQLIDELLSHATQRQFVYTHRWRAHDLVMWDNRCTMHRGTPFDDVRWERDVQRATVTDLDDGDSEM